MLSSCFTSCVLQSGSLKSHEKVTKNIRSKVILFQVSTAYLSALTFGIVSVEWDALLCGLFICQLVE